MNIEELKKQAEQLVPWMVNSAWECAFGTAAIGHTDEDDNQHEIAVFDTTMYDGYDGDSIKLAEFFAAANPAAVLELIAEVERVTKQRDELLEENKHLKELLDDDAFNKMRDDRDLLQKQRGELLAALKDARRELAYAGRQESHDAASSAIAKAEG